MCSVLSWKRRSQWNILAINMLSSQPRKCIYFFPYILCVAYLFAFAKYNIPLIQSTASKLLCGFCSTPGILQINCCTEFVLKKAFICFQTIHLAKWKESSSIFSQAVWSPLTVCCCIFEGDEGDKGQGRAAPSSAWAVSMANAQCRADRGSLLQHVHISPQFQPQQTHTCCSGSSSGLLLDTHFTRGIQFSLWASMGIWTVSSHVVILDCLTVFLVFSFIILVWINNGDLICIW